MQNPDGKVSRETFKVDTGADRTLVPISMFMQLFPKVSLDTLSRMIGNGVTLFAYNNTPIKQYGTCSIIVNNVLWIHFWVEWRIDLSIYVYWNSLP